MRLRCWGLAALLLAACAGCFAAGLYLGGGAHLLLVTLSPDGRERVEAYAPTRWQALTAGSREIPAVLRLATVADGTAVGADSPLVDLNDAGAPTWQKGAIVLGVTARFDRATGRWTSYEHLTQ